MRRVTLFGVLICLLFFGAHSYQAKQAPNLDQLDNQLLDLAFEAYASAQAHCDAQPESKHARKLSEYVNAMVKVKYPGYVVDWQNRRLVVRQ